jgi:mannose-1-phosphate guanylyltransferase
MNRFVRRQWGWYLVLLDFPHFKIKLLRFHQGKSLSLQYHESRNELWLFLLGGGCFKLGSHFTTVAEGDYILAEKGAEHKYYASRSTWAIEVQYGDKCVEEDIVRI